MSSRILFIITSVLVTSFSCSTSNQTANSISLDGHEAKNSLDWEGTYSGVLPCASCPGIETEIILNKDQTFVLTQEYLEKQSIFTSKGKFTWYNNNIQLEDSASNDSKIIFKVEEGRLRKLDIQGNKIEGALANNYILYKNGNPEVENVKWFISSINGKAITGDREAYYLVFHSKESRMEARANCNRLQFEYKIKNQQDLIVKQGMSTLMACPDTTEQVLMKSLTQSVRIKRNSDILSFYGKDDQPLIICVINKN
ncbi:copper resistance protein NlpE N-terminal domain-containing protein [Sediminibacterium sp. C3]|uniref:copper resistance protein NlpE N-terminal domain-containing protein n=1 Tax=Sediminibacterium sp. C3 TaxID=1267211 RepID=UPI000405EBA4|nr:copper resistance protein NlpE N-terminal domain-containing protein [Sediminibacterium sp. C3]